MPKFCISILIICLALLSWVLPVQAKTTSLEEEVLQVIRTHPEVVLESVQKYQQQQQEKQQIAQLAALQEVKSNPDPVIGEAPTTGAPSSQVVLIEFSDFQCSYCAQAHKTVKQFLASHDEVKLAYKHFPLINVHPEAMPSALSAWAAGQQGKFWQYHDALFNNQNKLGETFYVNTAKKLNLDLEKWNSDRLSNTARDAIVQDIKLGIKLGVSSTPFFILNGQIIVGAVPLSELQNLLAKVDQR
ncbi:MAG: thioredoxin domain-containing protein [Chamaesiphon sp.]